MTFKNALEKKKKMLNEALSFYPVISPSPITDKKGCLSFIADLRIHRLTDECAKRYSNNDEYHIISYPKHIYFILPL